MDFDACFFKNWLNYLRAAASAAAVINPLILTLLKVLNIIYVKVNKITSYL